MNSGEIQYYGALLPRNRPMHTQHRYRRGDVEIMFFHFLQANNVVYILHKEPLHHKQQMHESLPINQHTRDKTMVPIHSNYQTDSISSRMQMIELPGKNMINGFCVHPKKRDKWHSHIHSVALHIYLIQTYFIFMYRGHIHTLTLSLFHFQLF